MNRFIDKASNQQLPRPLRLFWSLQALLTALCAVVMVGNKYLLHRVAPYTWPVIHIFGWVDFFCFQPRFQHIHHLDFFSHDPSFGLTYMYPAPVAILYAGFYAIHWHTLAIFFFVTGGLVMLLAALLGRSMLQRGVSARLTVLFLATTLLLSYPLWFECSLGNMEICIFLLVAFALLALVRKHFMLAAILIGVAASMKIYPFVYLALLLSLKRYRAFVLGLLVAALVNVGSLWLICPSLPTAYRGIESGLSAFRAHYMLEYLPVETGFDHSIFGFIKRVSHHWLGVYMPSNLLTGYLALASVGGVALYFLRIRKLPILNQILCLCVASILLPPTSHDYTLLHLYGPWGLMVIYTLDRVRDGGGVDDLCGAFACFAVLLSCESEFIYKAGYSGQIKAITLGVLLAIALKRSWGSPLHLASAGTHEMGTSATPG